MSTSPPTPTLKVENMLWETPDVLPREMFTTGTPLGASCTFGRLPAGADGSATTCARAEGIAAWAVITKRTASAIRFIGVDVVMVVLPKN